MVWSERKKNHQNKRYYLLSREPIGTLDTHFLDDCNAPGMHWWIADLKSLAKTKLPNHDSLCISYTKLYGNVFVKL